MPKNDLTDAEIVSLIEQEEQRAYGINDADLASSRAKALNYYNGEVDQSAPEGRSNVVSRDVLDTVEAALPQLLKIFVSGDEVVRFDPRGIEDVKGAEQETDYVNHVVMEKNNGFALFYTWFKDALLSKNGYVKAWYEEEAQVEETTYQGLTDVQLQILLADESVTVLAHTPIMGADGMYHDVKVAVSRQYDRVRLCNVAPEDIMVSTDCRDVSVRDARFVQHRAWMTRAEMENQGWKVPEDLGYTEERGHWQEEIARDLYNEEANQEREEILVKDTYLRRNGERHRYVLAGRVVVHRQESEEVPIATITPHIMPHRHVGMSYADLTTDVQDIKTALVRSQLDNQYLANNGRVAISDKVNLEDLLTSRPGGVVRVQGLPGNEVMPLQHPPLSATSFSMVEYMDSVKEKRTGITAYNQGMDADTLNKTATGISQIMSAAQQRLELVARTFAETGVKELFLLVHGLIRRHYTKPDVVRLRNEWVDVDPRQWQTRSDMSIAVGLGTGNKDQQLMHLQTILMAQKEAAVLGLATPKNIYNALAKLTINAGFKNPEEFWTDPDRTGPPPEREDPKLTAEKLKIQADQQKFQAQAQIDAQSEERKAQLDIQKFQAQAELDQRQAAQNAALEAQRSQNDLQIEREKMVMEAEVKRFEIQVKAETELKVAAVQAEMQAKQMAHQFALDQEKADRDQQRHEEQIAATTRAKTATMPDGRQIKVE